MVEAPVYYPVPLVSQYKQAYGAVVRIRIKWPVLNVFVVNHNEPEPPVPAAPAQTHQLSSTGAQLLQRLSYHSSNLLPALRSHGTGGQLQEAASQPALTAAASPGSAAPPQQSRYEKIFYKKSKPKATSSRYKEEWIYCGV